MRIPADIWLPAMARAKREGTTLTAVVVAALTAYGMGEAAGKPEPRPVTQMTVELCCPHRVPMLRRCYQCKPVR